MNNYSGLLILFLFLHPTTSAGRIYKHWYKDIVLKEYNRPDREIIEKVVYAFQKVIMDDMV